MFKGTPGPWGCKRSETGPWAIFGQDGSFVATTCKKQWVAEDLANARLIAAAHELLAALQSMFNEHGEFEYSIETLSQARTAISKATGA